MTKEEDLELNEKTKKEIEIARKSIKAGKFITEEEAKNILKIKIKNIYEN